MTVHRLNGLDTLRAFAVFAVMIEHYSGFSEEIPIGAGALGVGLFFTLSGFLITSLLLFERHSLTSDNSSVLKGFYIRRGFRLFPPFFIVILVLFILDIGDLRSSWGWHVTYLSNVYMALGGQQNVFWTLSVEEQFYIFWPILLFVTPTRHLLVVIASTIGLCLCLKIATLSLGVFPDYRLLPFQLTRLSAGAVLGVLCFREGVPFKTAWLPVSKINMIGYSALFCLAVAAAISIFDNGPYLRLLFNDLLCVPLFIWLLMSALTGFHSTTINMIFRIRFLHYLGRISYGIYLIHNWIPKIIDKYVAVNSIEKLALTIFLTLVVASLSWFLIEKPLIAVGRRLSKRKAASGEFLPVSTS